MNRKPYSQERTFVGRLPGGADLLASITRIANEEGIKLASVSVHGSVASLMLTIFDQTARMQRTIERNEGMEIASLTGTISQFKGRSMARLDGVFAALDGSLVGGSVALGTVVYACEVIITELAGGTLTRDFDIETGLPLWKESSLLVDRNPSG